MASPENKIQCTEHGSNTATFICEHLKNGEELGVTCGYDPDDIDYLYPDIWCDQCNDILEAEGEWNDAAEAFANIQMVCSKCYLTIRKRNWVQDETTYEQLVEDSFNYLQERQAQLVDEFDLGQHERWDWYQESRKLVFSHEGEPKVEAEIDFVGTFSTASDTWRWAWANTSLLDPIKAASRNMRTLGDELGFHNLALAQWEAVEEDAWEMTAIMAKQFGAIGAYRTPEEHGMTFMIIRDIYWL